MSILIASTFHKKLWAQNSFQNQCADEATKKIPVFKKGETVAESQYFFEIGVHSYNGDDCQNCQCVKFFGTLYAGCSGACKPQGYTLLMDANGKMLRFIKSDLQKYSSDAFGKHEKLSLEESARILDYLNNQESLKQFYDLIAGQDGNFKGYTARTSGADFKTSSGASVKGIEDAGNTLATVLLHASRVREDLGLKDWPTYQGKTPVQASDTGKTQTH